MKENSVSKISNKKTQTYQTPTVFKSNTIKRLKQLENIWKPEDLEEISKKINLRFQNPLYLAWALTHRSALTLLPPRLRRNRFLSNEQLEFLGDAVLQLCISKMLLNAYPIENEGKFTKWRSAMVRRSTLALVSNRLKLGEFVLISKKEERDKGRQKDSILCDTLEALIGAYYLDQGLNKTFQWIGKHFSHFLKDIAETSEHLDYKSKLQETLQAASSGETPEYRVGAEEGPDHAKEFVMEVFWQNKKLGTGKGQSKKTAEQEAAKQALEKLQKKGSTKK